MRQGVTKLSQPFYLHPTQIGLQVKSYLWHTQIEADLEILTMGLSPGQLVDAVAMSLDIPREVVFQHDRKLAEAGLRTKGARGVNAPDMTSEDAAVLLIAVMTSLGGINNDAKTVALVEDAADAPCSSGTFKITDLSNLPGVDANYRKRLSGLNRIRRNLGFPRFRAAIEQPGMCTFRQALAALIDDAIDGELEKYLGVQIDRFGRIGPYPRRDTFQLKFKRPNSESMIGFDDGSGSYLEFQFHNAIDTGTNLEIISTHEMTAVPLLRLAGAMRN